MVVEAWKHLGQRDAVNDTATMVCDELGDAAPLPGILKACHQESLPAKRAGFGIEDCGRLGFAPGCRLPSVLRPSRVVLKTGWLFWQRCSALALLWRHPAMTACDLQAPRKTEKCRSILRSNGPQSGSLLHTSHQMDRKRGVMEVGGFTSWGMQLGKQPLQRQVGMRGSRSWSACTLSSPASGDQAASP